MSDLERELRAVLNRKQPPAGFERRVAERVASSRRFARARRRWIPAAVAAALLIAISGAYWQRQREAERGKEQLILALQITGQKMARVEQIAARHLGTEEK